MNTLVIKWHKVACVETCGMLQMDPYDNKCKIMTGKNKLSKKKNFGISPKIYHRAAPKYIVSSVRLWGILAPHLCSFAFLASMSPQVS